MHIYKKATPAVFRRSCPQGDVQRISAYVFKADYTTVKRKEKKKTDLLLVNGEGGGQCSQAVGGLPQKKTMD